MYVSPPLHLQPDVVIFLDVPSQSYSPPDESSCNILTLPIRS